MEAANENLLKKDIIKFLPLLNDVSAQIPDYKRSKLHDLALYINSKLKSKSWVKIVFVSPSDNSLSQLGQIWAKAISVYNSLNGLETYSAGKRRQINPVALNVISQYGFEIQKTQNGDKPVYSVKYADTMPAIKIFSKPLKHPENPDEGYVALIINPKEENQHEMMLYHGAEFRVPLIYEVNPYENDEEKYQRLCKQIGADIFFIFSNLDKAE